MAVNHTIEGNKLIITVDLDVKPTQSKSAMLKAAEKGIEANKVPATMVATSGGFVRADKVKYSLNVSLA